MANARILVIEDDEDTSETFAALLEVSGGYSAERANSFEDAKTRLVQGEYDLVLLDHNLWQGHVDRELYSIIRPGIPVISCTAQAHLPIYKFSGRPSARLVKPVKITELLETVAQLLAQVAGQLPATT